MSPQSQIRMGIYWHLFATGITLMWSRISRRIFISPEVDDSLFDARWLQNVACLSILSGVICPLIVYRASDSKGIKPEVFSAAIFCEAAMIIAQIFIMWPTLGIE